MKKNTQKIFNKNLFNKIVSLVEDYLDRKAVKKENFKGGKDFEEVAKELGI